MIDYDKLKIAHTLAEKIRPNEGCILIDTCYRIGLDGEINPYYLLATEDKNGMHDEFEFYSIDDLIIKLNELTDPEQECQHQSDGHTYPLKHPQKYKCKKCAEFYK